MPGSVQVFPTVADLVGSLEVLWKELSEEAVGKRGTFSAALSGGLTPRAFYGGLVNAPGLPWARTQLFLVDERLVPVDNRESNSGLLLTSLVHRLVTRPLGVHLPRVDGAPDDVASSYEREIRSSLGGARQTIPVFDLVVLGIGEDGHTASLFPGEPQLEEQSLLVVAVPATPSRVARVTMTLPLLNAARNVVFLVTGDAKRRALAGVVRGDSRLPAARVRPRAGRVRIFTDAAALPGD